MIILWKKYIKKFIDRNKFPTNNSQPGNIPNLGDSFKLLNEMMKNLPKG